MFNNMIAIRDSYKYPARVILGALLAVACCLPLLAHIYLGWFARYLADDYCYAGQLRLLGFLATQKWYYVEWSGRFAFTFLESLALVFDKVKSRQ